MSRQVKEKTGWRGKRKQTCKPRKGLGFDDGGGLFLKANFPGAKI